MPFFFASSTDGEIFPCNAMSMKNMYLKGVGMMQQGATALASSLVCKLTQQDLQSFYNFATVRGMLLYSLVQLLICFFHCYSIISKIYSK
jgi:hypothetical protein